MPGRRADHQVSEAVHPALPCRQHPVHLWIAENPTDVAQATQLRTSTSRPPTRSPWARPSAICSRACSPAPTTRRRTPRATAVGAAHGLLARHGVGRVKLDTTHLHGVLDLALDDVLRSVAQPGQERCS